MTEMAEGYLNCGACGHVFSEEDAGPPVYECGTCGQPQAGEDEEARKCQQCHKFCAKVASRSCPECEAPEEELGPATKEDLERYQQEQGEAERRRKEPRKPDPTLEAWQRDREEQKEKDRAWWKELGRAFFEGVGEQEGFGDLPARIEHFVIDGGSDTIQLDKQELIELVEKHRG